MSFCMSEEDYIIPSLPFFSLLLQAPVARQPVPVRRRGVAVPEPVHQGQGAGALRGREQPGLLHSQPQGQEAGQRGEIRYNK